MRSGQKQSSLLKRGYTFDAFMLNQMIISGRSLLSTDARAMVHFIVVQNKKSLQRLEKIHGFSSKENGEAAAAILILADIEEDEFWIENAAIAAAGIQMTAERFGINHCRVQMRNRQDENGNDLAEQLQDMMQFPSKVEPVSMMFLFNSCDQHTTIMSRLNKIHYEKW